jgi:3-phosphoshikimate 1-carboxyvinyltransferase
MTDSPITFDKGPRPRTTILEDLLDIDARLLAQVARRIRLVQRAAKGRQVLDRDLEKQLWSGFDQMSRQQNLDPRLARQLFALLGSFGLEAQPQRRAADKPFTLIPRSESADVDITGPRSRVHTRLLAVLAAATGQPVRLSGVVLSDPLIELVKALNQCGAHLAWADDALTGSPLEKQTDEFPLMFEDVLVFAGEEPFTLYVLLAMALRDAGRSKFAGGAGLKSLDLRPLDALLPLLGARLAPMNPRTRGLPARLESGGRMASRIELAPETPPLFAQALAIAAWSYPEGLRLALSKEPNAAAAQAAALDDAVSVLNLSQVKAQRKGDEYVIPAGKPKLPKAPDLPLDQALSAYVLALPAMAGGFARLSGQLTLPAQVLADFNALGLAPTFDGGAATCRNASLSPCQNLGMGRDAKYLALALALALKAGGATVALPAGPAGTVARAWAVDLLDRLGARFDMGDEPGDDTITITSGPQMAWEGVWTAPDAWSTMGLALISFIRPGIALDNPGGLAALWPRFWALFNSLPIARDPAPAPKEPEKHDTKPRNRRVRISE